MFCYSNRTSYLYAIRQKAQGWRRNERFASVAMTDRLEHSYELLFEGAKESGDGGMATRESLLEGQYSGSELKLPKIEEHQEQPLLPPQSVQRLPHKNKKTFGQVRPNLN
jgi:hypothetical protein